MQRISRCGAQEGFTEAVHAHVHYISLQLKSEACQDIPCDGCAQAYQLQPSGVIGVPSSAMEAFAATYTYVSTPQELQDAVSQGAQDVVIQRHLDLTGLSLETPGLCDRCKTHLGHIYPKTRLLRVRACKRFLNATALHL
jgi:hypothetical protein